MRIDKDGLVGIGVGDADKLLTLGQDAADGLQTAYIKILDKDTDTTANTLLEILWSKYHTGTSAADVASIGGGVEQWSGTSSNRHKYIEHTCTVLDLIGTLVAVPASQVPAG